MTARVLCIQVAAREHHAFVRQLGQALEEGWQLQSSGRTGAFSENGTDRGVWWALLLWPQPAPAEPVLEPARAPSSAAPATAASPAAPAPAEALLNARGGAREHLMRKILRALADEEGHGVDLVPADRQKLAGVIVRELSE